MVFRANTNWSILSAALDGLGIATLPTFLVRDYPALVEVRAPRDTMTLAIWLVLHKDPQQTARVRACADLLASEVARMTPELLGTRRARKD